MTRHDIPPARFDASDDMPIALRRKRRASTSLTPSSPPQTRSNSPAVTSISSRKPSADPQTPSKSKKRVRFSDPGPSVSARDHASTGITPSVARTTLMPVSIIRSAQLPLSSPRLQARPLKRRQSLPTMSMLTIPSSSGRGLPSPPLSGEIQFEALRQILTPREKRRLSRRGMSEEMNDIEAEKKGYVDARRREEEVRALKDELALARQLGSEIVAQTGEEIGNRDRISELEDELEKVKEELRDRLVTAEPAPLTDDQKEEARKFPAGDIFEDEAESDDLQMIEYPDNTPQEIQNSCVEATTQTSLTSSEMTLLQDHIREQTGYLVTARLDLEYMCPGETTLGLTTEQGNAKPILDALLDRLRALKSQLRISEGALATTRTQESNMRNQFNTALMQLDSARSTTKDLAAQSRHVASVSADKVRQLEADIDEKQRSIGRLQKALETYRTEVKDLECLVTRLETEHKIALTDLKSETDEAVADLECHVAAETRGRREAEEECEHRLQTIKQLENKEVELKDALNEKQRIIRKLEEELDSTNQGREQEVGALNVRVAELSSSLSEVRKDLMKVEAERSRLIGLVEVEKTTAIKVTEKMRDEMRQCLEHVETVRDGYEKDVQDRGNEVAEHQGLLTPVSAVRFKDFGPCEGYIEVRRGKTRTKRGVDSGIGILAEDEDEDMVMVM